MLVSYQSPWKVFAFQKRFKKEQLLYIVEKNESLTEEHQVFLTWLYTQKNVEFRPVLDVNGVFVSWVEEVPDPEEMIRFRYDYFWLKMSKKNRLHIFCKRFLVF